MTIKSDERIRKAYDHTPVVCGKCGKKLGLEFWGKPCPHCIEEASK